MRKKYEDLCNEYAKLFAKKHDLNFDYWIGYGHQVGGVASFSETYYFNIENIRLDIDNDVPKKVALKWYEDSINHYYTQQGDINYFSYLMSNNLLKID